MPLPVVQSTHHCTITNKHPPVEIWSRKDMNTLIKGMWFIVWWRQKKSDFTLNYLVYPKKRGAGWGSEVEMMKEAGSTFTGSHFTTISQHFLPPPVVEFYFITFTHSYSLCLLLSTVAETVSHFKEWESGFKKKKSCILSTSPTPPECQTRPLSLSLSLIPLQEIVVEEMSASSNYYKTIMVFFLKPVPNIEVRSITVAFKHFSRDWI